MDVLTLNLSISRLFAVRSSSARSRVDANGRIDERASAGVRSRTLRRWRVGTVKGLARFAIAMSAGFALTACYVLPINPNTGQPYATAQQSAGYPAGQASAGNGHYAPQSLSVPPAPSNALSTLNVRLYPVNPQANHGGILAASVVDNNAGHGTFTVPYLGDTLQGESTRVDAGYAAFGRIYAEVLGAGSRNFSGLRGIANAHGAKGVNAQCEYVLTGPGAGTGVCRFSDGANYQMHFGG